MAIHTVDIPEGWSLATLLVPKTLPQMQVNQVMTNAATTLAQLNGMDAQRIADPQMLGYRVFPIQQAKPPPPKVVSLVERRKAARPFHFPTFTPPSAA